MRAYGRMSAPLVGKIQTTTLKSMHKPFMSYNLILDKQEFGEILENPKHSNFL